jgi:hypothetical protein
MSLTSSIISQINTQYSNVVFADAKYDTKKIVGLAWPYPELKGSDTLIKIVPATYGIDKHGSGDMIDLNDQYALILYHKISSASYQLLQTGKVRAKGDDYLQQHTIDVTMTVWAQRDVLQTQPDDIGDILLKGLPTGITLMPGIIRCNIIPVSTDYDFVSIFRREYAQVNYFLKPNQMLLQLKYRISLLVDPKCLELGVYSGTIIFTEDDHAIYTES